MINTYEYIESTAPVLIVGSGLSAICVAGVLHFHNLPFRLLPLSYPYGGTQASSGILQPLLGKKRLPDVHFDRFCHTALRFYRRLETELNASFFTTLPLLEFPETAQEAALLQERATTHPHFLTQAEAAAPAPFSPTGFPAYEVKNAFLLNQGRMRAAFQQRFVSWWLPEESSFDWEACLFREEEVLYQGKQYSRVILANGSGLTANDFFKDIPLGRNKGQAGLVHIPALTPGYIYKRGGLTLVPWSDGSLWWAGASFEWQYEHPAPTNDYRQALEQQLKGLFSQKEFTWVDGLSGIRPSPRDRRAMAGWHPRQKLLGLLNGMGTKGVLQAPEAAQEMVATLLTGQPPEFFGLENRFFLHKKDTLF